jgi:hypothetical protein
MSDISKLEDRIIAIEKQLADINKHIDAMCVLALELNNRIEAKENTGDHA